MLLLCQCELGFEGVEDDADEESFEAADCFASAFAFVLFAFDVGACGEVVAGLCDRDAVEGGVELAVLTWEAIEAANSPAQRARLPAQLHALVRDLDALKRKAGVYELRLGVPDCTGGG